jgi:hypothetical protein
VYTAKRSGKAAFGESIWAKKKSAQKQSQAAKTGSARR